MGSVKGCSSLSQSSKRKVLFRAIPSWYGFLPRDFKTRNRESGQTSEWEGDGFHCSYSIRLVDDGVDCFLIELWDPIPIKLLLQTALSGCCNCCIEKSNLFLTLPSFTHSATSLRFRSEIAAEPSLSGLKGVTNLLFMPASSHQTA